MNCCLASSFKGLFQSPYRNLTTSEETTISEGEETASKYFLNCCHGTVDQAHPTSKVMCQRQ